MACEKCDGTGFTRVYDWVPYAGGGTQMPSDEPCPLCLGAGRCPRCGEVMDEGAVENLEACDKCGHKLFEEVAR
jgi:hypothetical protein